MKTHLVILIISFIWVNFLPFFKKFIVFQYCSLIILSFLTGFILKASIHGKEWPVWQIIFYILLILVFIIHSIRFYKANFKSKSD
jgi:hypothetical protein